MRRYDVSCSNAHYFLMSPKGTKFALLDVKTSKALRILQSIEYIRYEAVVSSSPFNKQTVRSDTRGQNGIHEACINIYGTQSSARQVSATLTEQTQYLQHPLYLDYGIEYRNPHYFVKPGSKVDFNQYVEKRYCGSSAHRMISNGTTQLLDSLDFVGNACYLPPIDALQTPLLRLVVSHS